LDSPFDREYDTVISAGEQVAAGLLAMCLRKAGIEARSLNSWQIPITASGEFSNAEIQSMDGQRILQEIEQGIVPVITGFQGISENRDILTIGRGGSDATACAVSKAINAGECLIYTDVDGVYTADPRITLNAKRLDNVSYDDMVALASHGAKVLQDKSVRIAKQYGVRLKVLSSFADGGGTNITEKTDYISSCKIAGIAHSLDMFALRLSRKTDMDIVRENTTHLEQDVLTDTFMLFPKAAQAEVKTILDAENVASEIDNDIGVVTVVGGGVCGMETMPACEGVNIKATSRGDNTFSVVVPFLQTEMLVNALHKRLFEKTV
jgi:aspartate kinase